MPHPSHDNIPAQTQSISLLLRVPAGPGSVSCIIIVKDDDRNHTVCQNIRDVLGSATTYELIRAGPFHLINILCGQLSEQNEKLWCVYRRQYERLEASMFNFCRRPNDLYRDHGRKVFGVMHRLNLLQLSLGPLEDATAFEMRALEFAREMREAHRKISRNTLSPLARLEQFLRQNRYLTAVAHSRQVSQQRVAKQTEISVGTVNDSFF